MNSNECRGSHHFFIASTQEVPISSISGKIVIIAICTNCGESRVTEHKITKE